MRLTLSMTTSYTNHRSPRRIIRYSIGTSVPCLVVSLVRTLARSPSTLSPAYWIFSPPYSSIFEMYDRSRRSPNSLTNSSRWPSVSVCQWRASERRAVSAQSKMSLAITRTCRRRSRAVAPPFRAGSSSVLTTRSTWVLSWSVAGPVQAPLHFTDEVHREQLVEIDRRLGLPDPAVRAVDPPRAPRADADVLLAGQALGLDRGVPIVRQLAALIDQEHHLGLVVHEA